MASTFGKLLQISVFGQSHGAAIGVTMDGLPAGLPVEMDKLQAFLARRAPGQGAWATPRKEADAVEILSGLVDGVTCGAPLTAVIRNTNTRSGDYAGLHDCPRPGHADYPAEVKYKGAQDAAGGGHFSGRLTAPICIAGGICLQLLAREGVLLAAHLASVGSAADTPFDPLRPELDQVYKEFPVLSSEAGEAMRREIAAAKAEGDSIGGVVECAVVGLPVGLGEPMFGGMENRIAQMVFGIPAVKGVEFGAGFGAAKLRGSQNNDPYVVENSEIRAKTNHAGGILGGITNGMPLIFRAAFKPTPSIAKAQESVSLAALESKNLIVHGRHDPCIAPRAVPVVEAAAAVAIYDAFLEWKARA
ncbi:MAG: chorismate synthase [Oscillospiraceae bacterium]|nr:chorismate synthase [Oscillospiraceae bacterium]